MSNPALSSEAQVRYILQWFGEFSELQREDFLPVLAAAHSGKPEQLAATLATLSCEDKPISLFKCRIKLFNEWYPTWTEEDRDRLITAVSEIDHDFGTKLQDAMLNGVVANGEADEEECKPKELEDNVHIEESVEETLEENRAASQENLTVEIAAAS